MTRQSVHVHTAWGTDMGAIGFVILTFQINKHSFTQKFIVCHQQTRNLILGQDFSIHNCAGCLWMRHHGTTIVHGKWKSSSWRLWNLMQVQYLSNQRSPIYIPQRNSWWQYAETSDANLKWNAFEVSETWWIGSRRDNTVHVDHLPNMSNPYQCHSLHVRHDLFTSWPTGKIISGMSELKDLTMHQRQPRSVLRNNFTKMFST